MDCRAADLDGDDRVEDAHRGLEGLEVRVLVGKDAEDAGIDAQADTGVDVLLRGLEPCITLGLTAMPAVSSDGDKRQWKWGETHLLEDVVKQSIVSVVIHAVGRLLTIGIISYERQCGPTSQNFRVSS